jgi:NADPH:quinone reductase-like Zn-dependent oxidoreductase
MMSAVVLLRAGGPEALRLEMVPVPSVIPHHALIRIRAAGLNRSERFNASRPLTRRSTSSHSGN